MCTLFINLYLLIAWGTNTVYPGDPLFIVYNFIWSNVVSWVLYLSETWMLIRLPSPLISGGLLSSLLCSSLTPFVGGDGGLVCELVGTADLLTNNFDSQQYREYVDLPLTCHPSPWLPTSAFRSSEVRRLLLDLKPNEGTDPLGVFPIFLQRTADRCSVMFRLLVRLGSFPAYWRQDMSPQFRNVDRHFLLPITDRIS